MGVRIPARQSATLIALGALAFGAALAPSAAVADYPGGNGVIAYSDDGGLYTIRPDESGVRQLASPDADIELGSPSWSPDGRRLVFARSHLDPGGLKASFDLSTIGGDGSPVTRILGPYPDPLFSPSFSPNGRRVVYVDLENSIFTIRTDGDARPKKVFDWGGGTVGGLEYSPNGRRIVFWGERPDERRLGSGIWTMRRDGSHLRRLTKPNRTVPPVGMFPASDTGPTFSPDGKHIAFLHEDATRYDEYDGFGDTEVHVMRADGSGEHPVPNTDRAGVPAYAPAGDRIALSIRSEDDPYCRDIYTISPTGSDRQRVTENCSVALALGSSSWQPDPPSTFVFGEVKGNKKRGTAKLTVEVFGPGELRLAKNKKLKGKQKSADSEGTVKLPIKPRRKVKKQLRREGKAKVIAKVTYTPDGGPPNPQSKKVGLKKKR